MTKQQQGERTPLSQPREAASRFTREVDTVRRTPAAALAAEAYRCAVRLANVSGKTVSIREVSGRIVLEVGP